MSDPLDDAMTGEEVRVALKLGVSTFYKHQARGELEHLELSPRIGPRRYSRKAVREYLDRENPPKAVRPLRIAKAADRRTKQSA